MLIGIVGKANCGKSTFFKACTLADVAIASYPFTTIKANEGVGFVKVKCPEGSKKCQPNHGYCQEGFRFVPFKLMDVAGLVPGASKGKGRGNEFLDDLREADVFIHIIDASGKTNEQGNLVENYDVSKDISWLENELDLWYAGIFKKVWKTFSREVESENANFVQAVLKQFSGLKVSEEQINNAIKITGLDVSRPSGWNEREVFEFASELRKISKPMIIAANKIDAEQAKENYEKLRELDIGSIPCSADSELALREAAKDGLIEYIPGEKDFKIIGKLDEKQEKALNFIKKNVLEVYGSTGVQEVLNTAILELLKYIVVYPVENEHKLSDGKGNVLPDAYLMPASSSALDLAYKVHQDIGKNFVAAIDCKTGKRIGKDYKLKHGDIVRIMTK